MLRNLPIYLFALLLLGSFSLTAQDEDQTVVEIIQESDNHSTLETLLGEANLVTALSAEGDTFTVFAPTNAAFAMLSAEDLAYFQSEAGADSLASVLTYHVIADSLGIDTFSTGMLYGTLNEGDSIFISGYSSMDDEEDDDDGMDTLMINGMMVEVTGIPASNGVVYSIDVILMQPVATVADLIMDTDTLSTLSSAVNTAGLGETLMGEGPFTVFAPSNDALANISADSLLTLEEDGDLEVILQYHVVEGRYTSADLMDGMTLMTVQGEMLEVTISGDSVMVDSSLITMSDMIADNGVVHVIDSILLPMVITSVKEPAFARDVVLAPNPASNLLTVRLPMSIVGRATVTLRDLTGRSVITRRANSDQEPLDVSALATGVYLLEVRSGGEAIQRKVMVQR